MRTQEALDRICTDLGLWRGDRRTQDWAFEVPDTFRTDAWLASYLEAFVRTDYGHSERQALFDLIFDILNDKMKETPERSEALWHRALQTVAPYLAEHRERIQYWFCPENDLEDAFAIAPFVRTLAHARTASS